MIRQLEGQSVLWELVAKISYPGERTARAATSTARRASGQLIRSSSLAEFAPVSHSAIADELREVSTKSTFVPSVQQRAERARTRLDVQARFEILRQLDRDFEEHWGFSESARSDRRRSGIAHPL